MSKMLIAFFNEYKYCNKSGGLHLPSGTRSVTVTNISFHPRDQPLDGNEGKMGRTSTIYTCTHSHICISCVAYIGLLLLVLYIQIVVSEILTKLTQNLP